MIRYLSRQKVRALLKLNVQSWEPELGWTYNAFWVENTPHHFLGENTSFDFLTKATHRAMCFFGAYEHDPFIFHDGIAAWRTCLKKDRGIGFDDEDSLTRILKDEIFFRAPEGRSDNYNIVDSTWQWMITYCHEEDWFVFHKSGAVIEQLKGELSLIH